MLASESYEQYEIKWKVLQEVLVNGAEQYIKERTEALCSENKLLDRKR